MKKLRKRNKTVFLQETEEKIEEEGEILKILLITTFKNLEKNFT